jgi:hypothetical protein
MAGMTLEERVERLEQILAGLGEVLKAGRQGDGEWAIPPFDRPSLSKQDPFEGILYNLGIALTSLNPPCPPWCGAIEEPEEPEAPPEPEKEGEEPEPDSK